MRFPDITGLVRKASFGPRANDRVIVSFASIETHSD
jgi:hypothetical protein